MYPFIPSNKQRSNIIETILLPPPQKKQVHIFFYQPQSLLFVDMIKGSHWKMKFLEFETKCHRLLNLLIFKRQQGFCCS